MDFVDRFQVGTIDSMAMHVSQAMSDAFRELSGDDARLHAGGTLWVVKPRLARPCHPDNDVPRGGPRSYLMQQPIEP